MYPGPRGFLSILSFLHSSKFAMQNADRSGKPLVKIVENLTFILAQHLTALKDVIFFWPITSPKIFNPSNHMTRRAIKHILQSETTVNCWWHESEDPNSLDQRLFLLRGSGSCRKICQGRIERSLWDQGNYVDENQITVQCIMPYCFMKWYLHSLQGGAMIHSKSKTFLVF